MSEARVLKIKSSLALKMERAGGRSYAELGRRADEALEAHRDRVMVTIREHLEALGALCTAEEEGAGGRIYAIAAGIVDIAGYFDTGPLYEAAYSLCDTVDRMLGADAWRWPSIAVHHRALALILADGCRTSQASTVLIEGLHAVARKAGGE